jgi:hypothetical protein
MIDQQEIRIVDISARGKNPSLDSLDHHVRRKGKTGWQSPKNAGQVDLGF